MKTLTTNDLGSNNLQPKSRNDNYYLIAMLLTAIALLGIAYYDQVFAGFNL